MGSCKSFVLYLVGAFGFVALGAVIAGLSVYYGFNPDCGTATGKEEIHAECVLTPSPDGGDIGGKIFFHQMEGSASVLIDGNITGLAKGLHGFHIHTYGVVGGDCGAAAGHYNPDGFYHAGPTAPERHVGDLGNIESVDDGTGTGTAYVAIVDEVVSLYGEKSVIGRSVVVHAHEDDLGLGGNNESLITGNAGPRVACCTIFFSPELVL